MERARVCPAAVAGHAGRVRGARGARRAPETGSATEQSATRRENARLLAEILQDDQARQALIDQLLQVAAGDGVAASGAAADEAAGTGDDVTIAREVASYTREAAESLGAVTGEVSGWMARLWQSLTTSGGHLEGLGEAALALIGIIVATIVIFHLLRFFADRLFRWLARRARDAGWLEIAMLLVAGSLVDALVILLAWAGGYALALYGFDGSGQMHTNQSLYLNAFLLIESSKVVLRFFLAPRYGDLRLVRLPDLQANYWYFWLSRIIGLLGYGMLLVVPIVRFNLPREIGAATEYLIGAAALAMAIVVILQNRQGLRQVLAAKAQAREGDFIGRGLMLLARIWHLLAMAYCVGLFVAWVVHPRGALPFMVSATGESILAIVLGIVVAAVISRAITAGLRLPDEVRQRLPLLEARLNAFVPGMLQVVRGLVLVGVVLMVARAWGVFDVCPGRRARPVRRWWHARSAPASSCWSRRCSGWRCRPGSSSGSTRNRARQPGPRVRTLLALLRNAATVVIATVTVMLVLSEVGVNIAPLLAGAGVLGLAVGFGAQKLVQDIITGAFIQFENAINEGEVVTVGRLQRHGRAPHDPLGRAARPAGRLPHHPVLLGRFGLELHARLRLSRRRDRHRLSREHRGGAGADARGVRRAAPGPGAWRCDRRAPGLAWPHRLRRFRRGAAGPHQDPAGPAVGGRPGLQRDHQAAVRRARHRDPLPAHDALSRPGQGRHGAAAAHGRRPPAGRSRSSMARRSPRPEAASAASDRKDGRTAYMGS